MRRLALPLIAALLGTLVAAPVSAAIYKWVDENGVITFRDTPPPAGVKAKVIDATPSFSGGTVVAGEGTAAARVQAPKVELFTTSWCPYCKAAVNYLRANNVPFTEYDIEKDAVAARRKDQLDSKPGVPFALINGQRIHGFNPDAYGAALKGQ